MSNIVLVAETGSDIPAETAKQYGIHLVPMYVSFENTSLADGSFPIERIYDYYAQTGQLPKTSGSMPGDFQKVFDEIHAQWPEKQILHLAYSAQTTCSYQSALVAAEGRDYVTSIDTKQVSTGQGAIVIRLAQILDADPELTLAAAIGLANQFCDEARMCFLPDDLAYLRAGGRVSNVAYMSGRIFHIHPLIEIKSGLLVATAKLRGSLKRIVPRLIIEYAKAQQLGKEKLYLLWSVGLKDEVKREAELAAQNCGFQKIVWVQTGCVITTHSGPGVFGIVGFSAKDSDFYSAAT